MTSKLTAVLLSALSMPGLATEATPKPNVIHILVDDLGWRDVGAYGSETYKTPHIDALAERGMVFSNAYSASPLCSPTRASTLTGQTVGRLRFTTPTGHLQQVLLDPQEQTTGPRGLPMTNPQNRSRLPLDFKTIGQLFKDAGYATALMGKWHLGFDPYIPENYGFEVVVGGRGHPGPPLSRFFGPWPEPIANMPEVEGSPNADDVIGDEAVRFIRANSGRPFFLCVTSLCAGASEASILSSPVAVKPDSNWQQLTLQLPRKIEGNPVVIHLSMEQPGRIQLKDFELK